VVERREVGELLPSFSVDDTFGLLTDQKSWICGSCVKRSACVRLAISGRSSPQSPCIFRQNDLIDLCHLESVV